MSHALVTVALPFDAARADAVDAVLDRMGNPADTPLRQALDDAGIIHFMSLTAIRDTAPGQAHLVLEASADRGPDPLAAIAAALGPQLDEVLQAAGFAARHRAAPSLLARHTLTIGPGWRRAAGVAFDGSPSLSVQRVRDEAALADRILTEMESVLAAPIPAQDKLRAVRDWLWQADEKWAFIAEPTPFLFGGASGRATLKLAQAVFIAALLLAWPLLAIPLGLMVGYGIWSGLFTALAVLAIAAGLAAWQFRRLELANTPDDTAPDAAGLEVVERRENYGAQNLLAARSMMQGGWLRRAALRLTFGITAQSVARIYRPGYLQGVGVIHFARWVLLPGTGTLLFYSNFSSTWESYLEDFITKVANGMTGIWSNTVGFPRTRWLYGGGAADGDRFRRWARRQQVPALFWYSAYPQLTTARIRLNAAIRRGIATARTQAEAEDWLSCFGSAPRPAFALEKPEIQTAVFGALRRMPHSAVLVLTFGADAAAARAWLRKVEPHVTCGEHTAAHGAATLAFSATGLAKLGLPPDALATFPVAFQHGMAAPWRARMLGDLGKQAPKEWLWGAEGADALLTLFAPDDLALQAAIADAKGTLASHGHAVAYMRVMKPLPTQGPVHEPFGFADGVSQPVLRDTPRARVPRHACHVVEAGEFVLGYPDGRGYRPPSPTIGAGHDPARLLPQFVDDPEVQRPPYAPGGSDQRDLGRNGTFVVVRQLEQDVAGLQAWLADAAAQVERDGQNVWHLPQQGLRKLLAAKMVGRWQDGSSLVRHPHAPAKPPESADNDFQFSREDPQGLRCPLGAHMRRANPRDSLDADSPQQLAVVNRHRLMRVGRQYEAEEGGKPGLMFTCLNADIERQFEFVQQTWLLGSTFHGLPGETDPALGCGGRAFTVPTRQGPIRLRGLPDFVQMRGGGYFFMPSRSALRYLGQ